MEEIIEIDGDRLKEFIVDMAPSQDRIIKSIIKNTARTRGQLLEEIKITVSDLADFITIAKRKRIITEKNSALYVTKLAIVFFNNIRKTDPQNYRGWLDG